MTTTTAQPTRTSLSRNAITVIGATVGALALWLVETRRFRQYPGREPAPRHTPSRRCNGWL